jgi:hypothetical protein
VSWKDANSKFCVVAIPFPILTVRVRHMINLLYTGISHVYLTNRVLEKEKTITKCNGDAEQRYRK